MSLKKLKVIMAIMIIMIMTAGITQSVYARDRDVLLSIPVQMELSHCNHADHKDQMFRIQLQAVGNAPEQENSEINISQNANGEFLLSFGGLGNYQYQISQIQENGSFKCDDTIYDLFVQVILDRNDELAVNAWVTKHGSDEKLGQITFKNICSDDLDKPSESDKPDDSDKLGDSDKPGDSISKHDGKTKNARTGDSGEIMIWIVFVLISMLGIVIYYRNNKEMQR